jgi:uncharacterized membrane protein YqjE
MESAQSSGLRRARDNGGTEIYNTPDGVSVGELFKQLGADSTHLIQQEMALAKTELKETASRLGQAATKLGIAVGIAIPGLMALTAFLVIAIGDLLNENYWLGALIVGVAFLLIAAVLAKRAVATAKEGAGVPETKATLRDDARWAKEEAKAFKREFTA